MIDDTSPPACQEAASGSGRPDCSGTDAAPSPAGNQAPIPFSASGLSGAPGEIGGSEAFAALAAALVGRDASGRPSPEQAPQYESPPTPEDDYGQPAGTPIPGREGCVVPDYALLKEIPFLDPRYNETYAYLVPRDPRSIYAFWEVGEGARAELADAHGSDFFAGHRLVLRVHRVTGIDFNGFNAHDTYEVDDWLDDKNEYWLRVEPDNHYVAELGYRASQPSAGRPDFLPVARTNTVPTPRGAPRRDERYAEWSQVQVDANAVEVPVAPHEWRFNQYHYWKNRTHPAPEENGYWALVLHQHLPFVHHPEYRVALEEQWFFEAVLSVYTQLLDMFWRLERDKVDFRITLSLTPSLLSMMQTPLLQQRASRHIDECIALATRERDNSGGMPWRDAVENTLHRFWRARSVFDAYEGDLTRGYRDFQDMGKVEIIACPATHMILPLYAHAGAAVRAQLTTGLRQYERVFGRPPRGMWLPENAFTPGIDQFLADAGVKWTLLNAHGVAEGDTRSFFGTDAPVISPAGVAFFGIDEETRASVWSREGGYPGHENYKEWYRDLGYEADWDYLPPYFKTANVRRNTGLKYYRITRKGGSLGEKEYYNPGWAEGAAHDQAGQFVFNRGAKAFHARQALGGRKPMTVSAYDAELFGHWWEEGPMWIESVFRKLAFDQATVRPVTPSEYLAEHSGHQRMTPGTSSWGKKDFFQTWVDGREYQPNVWVYRHMFRLCQRMADTARRHEATADSLLERALNQAARELMLAIASDWGFLIETGQAVRYSELRITSHAARARELLRQVEAGSIDLTYLCTLETADCAFAYGDMDFRVFAS